MCTIHTFDGVNADTKDRHLQQIADDWKTNRDGGSVIILDDHNEVIVRFQTTKLKHLLSCIKTSKGTRYVVHLRASTTPQVGVGGCHMFDSPSGEWIYCHNGIIRTKDAEAYRVDSIALGDELDCESVVSEKELILPDWSHHGFANVIAYNSMTASIFIHRSNGGQLHHDGKGNWSSHRIDRNYSPVSPGWYTLTGEALLQYPETPVVSYYRYKGYFDRWNDDEFLRDIPSADLHPDSLVTQDGTEYVTCDDCGSYEKESDMMVNGHDTLCPHCYAWNTKHLRGGK